MEARATAKYIRISPRKARLVADLVRGKSVGEALSILEYTAKAASIYIFKLLNAAVANAGTRPGIDVDNLYVKRIYVNPGPTLKRFRAGPQGRAFRILKRTCHITVILDEA
ncbi:MAG: 50S ribosomal protein L22 [Desulfobacterota bacterium]|nr:50S ribosomal protein L22 [Thermodesulfobacteriota bacterium]